MNPQELQEKFRQGAESVSAVVSPATSLAEAFAQAARLTKEQGGGCMAAPGWSEAETAAIRAACESQGLELVTQGLKGLAGRFHTGLTRAQWGVAESGTIVVESASEELRLATMLAETHVAVLAPSHIRADLFALEQELHAAMGTAGEYLAFITGPSRTADIELVLTLGAHGPRHLHILLLEESK